MTSETEYFDPSYDAICMAALSVLTKCGIINMFRKHDPSSVAYIKESLAYDYCVTEGEAPDLVDTLNETITDTVEDNLKFIHIYNTVFKPLHLWAVKFNNTDFHKNSSEYYSDRFYVHQLNSVQAETFVGKLMHNAIDMAQNVLTGNIAKYSFSIDPTYSCTEFLSSNGMYQDKSLNNYSSNAASDLLISDSLMNKTLEALKERFGIGSVINAGLAINATLAEFKETVGRRRLVGSLIYDSVVNATSVVQEMQEKRERYPSDDFRSNYGNISAYNATSSKPDDANFRSENYSTDPSVLILSCAGCAVAGILLGSLITYLTNKSNKCMKTPSNKCMKTPYQKLDDTLMLQDVNVNPAQETTNASHLR